MSGLGKRHLPERLPAAVCKILVFEVANEATLEAEIQEQFESGLQACHDIRCP
jgi:hypothetical protein